MTAQYENQIADLRVDLTIVSQELGEAQAELEALKAEPEDVPDEEKPSKPKK